MKDYIVKSKCSNCFKNIGIGWKFCPFCGEYVDNTKPKVDIKYIDISHRDTVSESTTTFKMPSTLKHVSDKIKETISEKLDKGEEVQNQTISLFAFVINKDNVLVQEMEEILTDSQAISLEKDHTGYYLQSNTDVIYINNRKIDIGKKHYLNNRDTLRVDDTIYIFSLMNQKDVEWKQKEINTSLKEKVDKNFEVLDNGNIYVHPLGDMVYLNNHPIKDKTYLNNYDLVSINHRLFVLYNNSLVFQHELTENQGKSLADNINRIEQDTQLSVRIRKRLAGEKLLLSEIDFQVSSGQIVLILGGSGAGKTTLINAIMA